MVGKTQKELTDAFIPYKSELLICSKPHTQIYLEALSSFDNGIVLPTYKDDEFLCSENSGIVSLFKADDILIHSHQCKI